MDSGSNAIDYAVLTANIQQMVRMRVCEAASESKGFFGGNCGNDFRKQSCCTAPESAWAVNCIAAIAELLACDEERAGQVLTQMAKLGWLNILNCNRVFFPTREA